MKINEFNPGKGIYHFELEEIKTEFHAHPAIEIIYSKNGGVKVETKDSTLADIYFAVIDANKSHKITCSEKDINIIMIEVNPNFITELFNQNRINLVHGIFTENTLNKREDFIKNLPEIIHQNKIPAIENTRVQICLNYLNSSEADYSTMIDTLKSKTHLSESRLSHIFKAEMGISIKKYMVWCRLKKAFYLVVDQNLNLYEAALQSGFYDQAHLSKAFKQLLGISPSTTYNSRTLQD